MKTIKMQPYQVKAIEAIQKALNYRQHHIIVEMATGSGKGIVLTKTLEFLNSISQNNILVVTDRMEIKKFVEQRIINENKNFDKNDRCRILVTTEQRVLRNSEQNREEYQFVVFYETNVPEEIYKMLNCVEKTVIVISADYKNKFNSLFKPEDVVFLYSYEDAVKDGVLTPAMDTRAFGPAVEAFSKQLLEQFGYIQNNDISSKQDSGWDLVVHNSKQRIWVECKAYRSQVVSPSAAVSLLNTIVLRKMKIPKEDTILLIVLSKIPSFQKDEIYDRYKIVVWDIENLVFYSKDNQELLKKLAQITYFPIDHIEGKFSSESEIAKLFLVSKEDRHIQEARIEADETSNLIKKLKDCKPGKKQAREYEEICEQILRVLFETNYFNKLRNQYKTKDEHFRMDLIGALKINQDNEKSMHPFWQMLVEHYNSHFVIFEFKNYSKEIDQNLIYITEKYLYDAALRNVAIIVSRKGFSKPAKFAAEGCLKEHGKLILNVTDGDLIKMLELNSDEASDYLLEKLEEFLMSISK